MKYIILRQFQFVKYVQFFFLFAILALSNTAYAALTVTVEPNNRGIISFLSDCNIVLSIGSDAVIDVSKLLIKLNSDDVTKEITSQGTATLSDDKRSLNISYPVHASDFHQGEYTFEVYTTGSTGDKAKLNIQEYKGKAICINCDGSSRSISEEDLYKIVEEETRAVQKATPKPIVVNGACGSSNGKTLTSKPSSNICNVGTATNVKETVPWTWNCNGANGGRNAVCSATQAASIPKLGWPISAHNTSLKFRGDWTKFATHCANLKWQHTGIDIPAAKGTPVLASEKGVVKIAQDSKSAWKKWITIEHKDTKGNQYTTVYWHLENLKVISGGSVARGQKIGEVADMLGNSHLHFGIRNAPYNNTSNHGGLPTNPDTNCSNQGYVQFQESFVDPLSYL